MRAAASPSRREAEGPRRIDPGWTNPPVGNLAKPRLWGFNPPPLPHVTISLCPPLHCKPFSLAFTTILPTRFARSRLATNHFGAIFSALHGPSTPAPT